MPNFQYESLSADGEVRSGVLTAASRAEAVRALTSRGETATFLEDADASGAPTRGAQSSAQSKGQAKAQSKARANAQGGSARRTSSSARSRVGGRPSLGRADLANLIRELATALEAGLPLMQSLKTVRRQAHGRALPVILDHLIERVEAGDPLYLAARDYGLPFDDMIVGMLRAADASGEMSEVLHQLADLLERSVELRRELMGATFYPMIVAGLLVVSVVVLVTVLVPRLIGPMAAQPNFEMPWPTAVVLASADFLQQYWYYIIGAIALLVFLWHAWIRVPSNRLLIDRAKLKAPLLGRLTRDVAVARFTRTLGTLTSAGLPILDALRITKNTLGNRALMAAVDQVQDQVTSGKSLADPLERSGLFPPLLIQVVNLGERSGRLDTMLIHAAKAFDRQVNASIKLFTKALPPLLLIVMAGLGGFVLAAILLPMVNMQSVVE